MMLATKPAWAVFSKGNVRGRVFRLDELRMCHDDLRLVLEGDGSPLVCLWDDGRIDRFLKLQEVRDEATKRFTGLSLQIKRLR